MVRGTTGVLPADRTRRYVEVQHSLAGDARAAHAAIEDAQYALGEAVLAVALGEGDEAAVQLAEDRLAAVERQARRLQAGLEVLKARVPRY
jgi:predicted negative regulator of RcsB-dependent stress response